MGFLCGVFDWDDGGGVTVAAAEFEFGVAAVPHGAAADGGAQGHPKEISVAELDASGFVPVVIENFKTGRRELFVEFVSGGGYLVIAGVQRDKVNVIGSDARGEDDAVVIVAAFNGCAEETTDADAVAAHEHGLFLAVLGDVVRRERFAEFRA